MRRRDLLQRSASALLSAALAQTGLAAHAQTTAGRSIELTHLQAERSDEGLVLSYTVRLELPKDVEDALLKGVAVVFLAEAELFRSRWYWSDKSKGRATRRWRLAFQPLTRRWRLSFDGLSRYYNSLPEALSVMQRATRWRIADNVAASDERDYHVDFTFKLDTDELPRPLQMGLAIQSDWNIAVQRQTNVITPR